MKFLSLMFALFFPCLTFADGAAQWTPTAGGQLILRPFVSAPYPHPSRASGWKYKETSFPADKHYNDSTVGIYIPAGYVPTDTVDYVVHFHGWSNHVASVLTHYNLPAQLDAAKVNAILIVPQGPKDAQDSGDGKLELDEGAFKTLISDVSQFLLAEHKIKSPRVGRIALSAHSGGYKVTAAILKIGGLTDHISDVLLLDASYGSLESFAEYCASDPKHRLVSLHTQHLDAANKELMELLDKSRTPYQVVREVAAGPDSLSGRGAFFVSTSLAHDEVPMKTNYFELLLSTSALPKIPEKSR